MVINPEKLPIPALKEELARLKIKRAKLDKYIAEMEADITRREKLK